MSLSDKRKTLIQQLVEKTGISNPRIHIFYLTDLCRTKSLHDTENTVTTYIKNNVKNEIKSLYRHVLERDVDPDGLLHYTKLFLDGTVSFSDIKNCLNQSDERKKIDNLKYVYQKICNEVISKSEIENKLVISNYGKGLTIRYRGPFGKTGYAQAAKSYFYSLFITG